MMTLMQKLRKHTAVVGVVGLGYVGLPLAVEMARSGFTVVGIDLSADRVGKVNRGENYIGDVAPDDLSLMVRLGRLSASADDAALSVCDCVLIAVPTPLDAHQQPDVSCVRDAARQVAPHMKPGMLVVLESTTYPGTTRELVCPILEAGGLKCGVDFALAFSPERVDPGNPVYRTRNTPKVVGGMTPLCTSLACTLYREALDAPVVRVSSPEVAEMEKILENTYRNVNIALVNELTMLCDVMGISMWEVIDAASSKPYGFQAFYPGPGVGGHCIPLDPCYLSWKAREYGFHIAMIETGASINDRMPEYVVERADRALNERSKSLRGASVLVVGLAYKRDVDDCRESPALHVIELLRKRGAQVVCFDPLVPRCILGGHPIESLPALTVDDLAAADLVIITTDHATLDYDLIARHSALILDTRNALKHIQARENIRVL